MGSTSSKGAKEPKLDSIIPDTTSVPPTAPTHLSESELRSFLGSSLSRVPAIAAAADTIDAFFGRIGIYTQSASTSHGETIAELQGAIARVSAEWKSSARRLQRHRSAWFDKHADEMDAAEKILQGGSRLCVYEGAEPAVVYGSVSALLPLVDSDAILPRLSSVIDVSNLAVVEVTEEVSHCSSVLFDLIGKAIGPGAAHCRPGALNALTLSCRDSFDDAVNGILTSDVELRVVLVASGDVITTVMGTATASPGMFYISYRIPRRDSQSAASVVSLQCFVFGALLLQLDGVPTLTSIEGVEVGGGPTFIGGNVVAVATSWDGKYLAVGRYFAPSITVFDLASGSQLNEIGEEGSAVRFHDLIKLCFNRSGNIIGAEDTSKRLQEVTVTGEFVRYYGVGVIDGHMYGVAANDEYVVTGGVAHIFLFHAVSGDFVRVFGSCGSQLGGVNSCYGMRFSLDGSRVIVTDTHNNRLSVFLLDGTFVECLGVGQLKSPRDLDFADNGDILVCCRNGITVFSPNGSTVIRNFRPIAMDKDNRPRADGYGTGSAISVRDGKLYIVFQYSSRVAVYQ